MQVLVTLIVGAVLDWLYKKAMSYASAYVARQRKKQEIEEENRRVREQNEAAKTPEERDASAKAIINRF